MSQENNHPLDIDMSLYLEIQNFMFAEAALLDNYNFVAWKDLLADDLVYYMPVRVNQKSSSPINNFMGADEIAHFDETKSTLCIRIDRFIFALESGLIPSEAPPPVTRHFISNIRINPEKKADCHEVRSLFILHRSRLEDQIDTFCGERIDILRRVDSKLGWEIVKRTIHLDAFTVPSNNLNVLF